MRVTRRQFPFSVSLSFLPLSLSVKLFGAYMAGSLVSKWSKMFYPL